MSTRNACLLLNREDPLCWYAPSRDPSRNGPLGTQTECLGEGGLTAGPLTGKKNGFSAHGTINAQIVNPVNAYSANGPLHISRMGKQAETEPSEFWKRLTEAWGAKGLPTSQNGIAMRLEMSQGSTRRWFTGEGLPETKVLRDLASQGGVTIDWLLDERLPKSPIGKQTTLGKFLLLWEQLDEAGKERIHRAALGELALKSPARVQASKKSGT